MAIKLIDSIEPAEYLDKTTKENLDAIKKHKLGRKYDYVMLITADKTGVGEGKSNLAHLICGYADPKNFTIKRVMFDEMDYRFEEKNLKPLHAFEFDEPDAFASTEAMTREQRRMKLKFGKIRQKRHLIVICAPKIFDVSKWVRGIGESRVNCVIRVVRRGVFYAYGDKTGALNAIKIDTKSRKIKWPECDFIGFFKKIPEKSKWWVAYLRKKNNYLKMADENPKAVKLMRKERKKMENAFTLKQIADIHKINQKTVRRYYVEGLFGKRGTFKGLDGRIYIKYKAYKKGIKRARREKQKGRPKNKKKVRKRRK